MDDHQNLPNPRLWLSYPWIHHEERDFNYLVPQLKNQNLEAVYESFQLQPNSRLAARTVQRLSSIGFDGWLYILTHQCFTRRDCAEQLTEAIDHTLVQMGSAFPMAGLMYGIDAQQAPPVLRVLPCISLGDPDWKRQLSGVMKFNAASIRKNAGEKENRFLWKIHRQYNGDPSLTAVEVRTNGESVQNWRFIIPKSARISRWGQGRAGGSEISCIFFAEASGSGRHENRDITWFGASNAISGTQSAYVVFSGDLPDFICFGAAQTPFGSPGKMEMLRPSLMIQN